MARRAFSPEGLDAVPYGDITHVCMTPSIHALLQYMLLFDYDTVARHTAYFTGYAVSSDIASRLPGVWFSVKQTGTRQSLSRIFGKIAIRATRRLRYPFLRNARIYAFDVGFVPPLIGRRPYALLSDGPLGISQNMQESSAEYIRQQRRSQSLQGHIEELLFGPVAVNGWGNNPQCREFYMTEDNQCVVFRDKPVHIDSLRSLWEQAEPATHTFVKHVFDVDETDIALLNSRPYMFCTQPMVKDGILSEQEYLAILRPIFEKYGTDQLLLKLHPRDDFDYRRYFPEVAVYDKKVNMQLLVLLGANVQRVGTICSSSVNSFPQEVQVDWYGTDFHPKLKAWFGTAVPPARPYNQCAISPAVLL